MSRRAARHALAGALLALGGCSYDLARLRGGGATPPGSCTRDAGVANARELGAPIGQTLLIQGDTTGRPSLLGPTPTQEECNSSVLAAPAPEMVYRYVMETGTRLYVTTDVPPCEAWLDTVVHIRTGCDPGSGSTQLACNDDTANRICDREAAGYHPSLSSSTFVDGLTQGQTVYVVVDGFQDNVGRFRLALTENGAPNARPPDAADGGAPSADRCGCPSPADLAAEARVAFPQAGDALNPSDGKLRAPGDGITATRAVSLASVAGVTLETFLLANAVGTGPDCAGATAVMDLSLDDRVVHSFLIDARTPFPAPLRVAFQTFAPVALTVPGATTVALRLRAITPANCGYLEFDLRQPSTLTLRGARPAAP